MIKNVHDNDASVGLVKYGYLSIGVNAVDIKEYLHKHVLNKSELPLHNKVELEELFRNFSSFEGKRKLIRYISSTLDCPVFMLDGDLSLFMVFGFSTYIKRNEMFGDELHSLLTFLDNPEFIQKTLADNFTLYPICFCFDFVLEDKIVTSLCAVSTTLIDNMVLGVVGKTDINFDLVVPLLNYISRKAI